MNLDFNTPIELDPVKRQMQDRTQNALDSYLDLRAKYGEEDSRTQMKLMLYVLRSYMITINEQVSGINDILIDFQEISDNLDTIFDVDIGESDRFTRGLDRYPRWMRFSIAKRRAKRYYNQKFDKLRVGLMGIEIKMSIMPQVLGTITTAVDGLANGLGKSLKLNPGGKKKKGGITLTPEMERAIAQREQELGLGGKKNTDGGAPAGGTSGGPVGGSDGRKPSGGDKWDD